MRTIRHWKVRYNGFWHHALDFRRHAPARRRWGHRCVVELVKQPTPTIRRVSWQRFQRDLEGREPILVREITIGSEEVFGRTQKIMRRPGYDVIRYNCEHFVNECLSGHPRSDQVRLRTVQGVGGAAGLLAAGALMVAGPSGSVGNTLLTVSLAAAIGLGGPFLFFLRYALPRMVEVGGLAVLFAGRGPAKEPVASGSVVRS